MPRTPRYRIQAVAEATGIPASTLRAWERRYGIPAPSRTSAAYRLYSERDVDLVRRMRDLCEGGLAPAEAAKAVLRAPEHTPTPEPLTDGPFPEARARILAAIEAFHPSDLRTELARASYLGHACEIFEQVLAPAMVAVGERWQRGALSVAQEHFATELLLGAVRHLCRLVQPAEAERLGLLACVSHERHELPLYGVAFRLASWGIRTEILGGDTPPEAIEAAVCALDPDLVGLSLTVPLPLGAFGPLADAYARACGDRPWLVGGLASEGYRAAVEARGGMVVGTDLAGARGRVERELLALGSR